MTTCIYKNILIKGNSRIPLSEFKIDTFNANNHLLVSFLLTNSEKEVSDLRK